ncbi:MAG: DUF4160 domain-containing protein [Herpetosiphonaceae bacterium]|nr:DUF4160 domain-containing protein [Herpetosiphonaceae bacterium]
MQVSFCKSGGFNRHELSQIQRLVEQHREQLIRGWNDYFND